MDCKVCDPPELCIHRQQSPAQRAQMVCTCAGLDDDPACPKHAPEVYCVYEHLRVLRGDYRWVEAGELKAGDSLWAFDEEPIARTRHWRIGRVVDNSIEEADTLVVVLENGVELIATPEHRWLTRRSAHGLGAHTLWKQTDALNTGDYLIRYLLPWQQRSDWSAGFLAAAFEGEGCARWEEGLHIDFAQKENIFLDRVCSSLLASGYRYRRSDLRDVRYLTLLGSTAEKLRVLGEIRPERLMWGLKQVGKTLRPYKAERVVAVTRAGKQRVAKLTSSTRTYLVEGFGAHNTQEQRAALLEAAEAMQATEMRESIRKRLEQAIGLEVKTFKGVCSVCQQRGIWLENAPEPLICGPCGTEQEKE